MKAGMIWAVGLATVALLAGCSKEDESTTPAVPTVKFTELKASGNITPKLTEFRTLLGDPLNTTPNQTNANAEHIRSVNRKFV